MKQIPLSGKYGKGKFALVDDEDYEELIKNKWWATKGKTYAIGRVAGKAALMHRIVMGVTHLFIVVDHKDGNSLNNQKENLRICSAAENARNRMPVNSKHSRFKGVTQKGAHWEAYIKKNSKRIHLGMYMSEEEAAHAYNVAASELFGEFAALNNLEPIINSLKITRYHRKKKADMASKYRGVCRSTDSSSWRAVISINGKQKHLGSFSSEIEAAKAYNKAAIELHGSTAYLNIIP